MTDQKTAKLVPVEQAQADLERAEQELIDLRRKAHARREEARKCIDSDRERCNTLNAEASGLFSEVKSQESKVLEAHDVLRLRQTN